MCRSYHWGITTIPNNGMLGVTELSYYFWYDIHTSFFTVYFMSKISINLPSLLLLCLSPSTCYARWRNRLVTIQGPLPYGANNCGGCQPSAQLVAEGNCTIPRGHEPPGRRVPSSWLRGIAPSLAASSTAHVTSTDPCRYFARDMASLGTEHG